MLGDIQWLSWKNKATQRKEEEEYAQWAFPYGEPQRQKITALLSELFPRERTQISLISFLTCKELFGRVYKSDDMYAFAIKQMKKDLKRYKNVVRKSEASLYAALAIADVRITAALDYPTADELRVKAKEFEAFGADEAKA